MIRVATVHHQFVCEVIDYFVVGERRMVSFTTGDSGDIYVVTLSTMVTRSV